jgi:hypothetical protein
VTATTRVASRVGARVIAVVAVVAVGLVAGCGGGGGQSAVPTVAVTSALVSSTAPAVVEGPAPGAAVVTLTSATVAGEDGTGEWTDEAVRSAVLDVLGRYFTQAMAVPMTGRIPDLSDVMTASPAGDAGAATADALTDAGIAVAAATPQVTAQTSLVALGVKDAPVSVVVATVDATSHGLSSAGVAIGAHRTGDVTLVLDGALWKIDSYHLTVDRESP